MKAQLHPEARKDFDEGFDWYAARSLDAAVNFAAEVDSSLRRIEISPERFVKIDEQHRCCLLERFPYHLVYRSHHGKIEVIAVAHGARRPGYWRGR